MSAEARRAWRLIVSELPPGLLTRVDWQVLTVACEAWSMYRDSMADVHERGILVLGDKGMVKNPAIQIGRDATQTLLRCWQELGLTPAARSRLEMPAPEQPDDLEKFFSPGGGAPRGRVSVADAIRGPAAIDPDLD